MFGKRVWRKAASGAVTWHQEESLSTTMFLLKELGPTGFLLKEDREPKNYKVFLGDPHTCTCGTFQKEKDLCKHICWILMRKFRLPRDHEYCFQTGLVERQILEVLQHPSKKDSIPSAPEKLCSREEDDGFIKQKDISGDDICPICQEELLRKRLPVAHCRFGCGNNIHISCIKVWVDHQSRSETDSMVKCPLCRETFSTLKMLLEMVGNAGQLRTPSERARLEKHLGIPCNNCRICPVIGKCFKCTVCSYYHLCEDCFKRSSHPQHSFAVRMKRNQSWQLMVESKKSVTHNQQMYVNSFSFTSMRQRAIQHVIQVPRGYSSSTGVELDVMSDVVPEHVFRLFPVIQIHQSSRLLALGIQCLLCLQSFHVGQQVKTLPCQHKFHSGCIKTWLRQSVCCPVDWHVIYNPLTWSGNDMKVISTAPPTSSARINQQNTELFVPGIGLQRKERPDVSKAAILAPVPPESIVQDTQALRIDSAHTATSPESIVQDTQALCIDSAHTATPNFCHSTSMQRRLSLKQGRKASWKRTSAKASCPSLSLSPVVERMEASTGTQQQSSFVGFNKHGNKAQCKRSSLHGQTRPMRMEGDGLGVVRTWPSSGDQSSRDLRLSNIPISAKHERN